MGTGKLALALTKLSCLPRRGKRSQWFSVSFFM